MPVTMAAIQFAPISPDNTISAKGDDAAVASGGAPFLMSNYHTHTVFCDGKDSPRDMARAASNNGLYVLGFSAHAMHPFSDDWHIESRAYNSYAKEVHNLRDEYAGKMKILLGFEADYIPGMASPSDLFYRQIGAEYIIGSVHYIMHKDGFFTVDGPVQEVSDGVERLFHGDARAAVCEYFALQREMLKTGGFEIWGHPDLFRKRNGVLHLFDERDNWYIDELKKTARQAAISGVIAEINTGGMARGAIDDVYPSAQFLHLLHDAGVPVMINSDAHRASDIAFGFDRALLAARNAGYNELALLCL